MKEPLDVRLGIGFWVLNIFLLLPTFGIMLLASLVSARSFPRRLEQDHLILRNGTRIPWSECTNVVKLPSWGRYAIVFGGTTIYVPTLSLAHGKQVIQWILDRLNVSFKKK